MRRSIRNFNIPPPRAYPGHLTVHRAWGGGNLNVALEGWGISPLLGRSRITKIPFTTLFLSCGCHGLLPFSSSIFRFTWCKLEQKSENKSIQVCLIPE